VTIQCEQCSVRLWRSFETAYEHRERARRLGWTIEVHKNRCVCPPCSVHQIAVELKANPTERRAAILRRQLQVLAALALRA